MIVSGLAAALAFAALAFAEQPWLLVGLAAVASICEAPFFPASQAAVPNLVPPDRLTWANATVSASASIGRMIGPLAGGVVVAAIRSGAAVGAQAGSFPPSPPPLPSAPA